MKYVVLVARIVMGLIFLFIGLNGLLHFVKLPLPAGDALTWYGIMVAHHWMNFVLVIELIGAVLLLVGRFVPLALALLAPVIVNILLYHALLWPHGYGCVLAIIVLIMELILVAVYWRNFASLFVPDPVARTPNL